jgi:D-amino peptidase
MSHGHEASVPPPPNESLSRDCSRVPFLAGPTALGYNEPYAFLDSTDSPILINREPIQKKRQTPMTKERVVRRVIILLASVLVALGSAHAEPYELSKNDVMEPKAISSTEISLFGVKLGDSESKAVETLVTEKISGVKVEQEATFIFLLDQRKPTGPMAGVRIQDGRVDLLFINNRFTYKTRGIFRNVLNSESPEEIRKVLGQEEYGDENVMGAVMAYDKQGFQVNYLGKDINIEFSAPR